MNPQHSFVEHLIFGCVMVINFICIKIFSISNITELVDLIFFVPLKILPFVTAYIAYEDKWKRLGSKIKSLFKKKDEL